MFGTRWRQESLFDSAKYSTLSREPVDAQSPGGAEDELDWDWDDLSCQSLREHTKAALEEPSSSTFATVLQYAMLVVVIASVGAAVLQTVPGQEGSPIFTILDPIFAVVFTTEIALRLWICDSTSDFFGSAHNVIDILATAPCYLDMLVDRAQSSLPERELEHLGDSMEALRFTKLLQVVRLLRILRVANTLRSSEIISVVMKSMWFSVGSIWVLMTFLLLGMVLSATCAYLIEASDPHSRFVSIPVSIWWAASTITAVGYGDLLPRTWAGKLLAIMTMFAGAAISAVCIAVVTNSFTIQFERELYASRIRVMQTKIARLRRREQCRASKAAAASAASSPSDVDGVPEDGSPTVSRQDRRLSSTHVAVSILKQRGIRMSTAQLDRDFSGMVGELEVLASELVEGLESVIDFYAKKSPDASGSGSGEDSRPPEQERPLRSARMALGVLKGSSKLWFQQARRFSVQLLEMSDGVADSSQR